MGDSINLYNTASSSGPGGLKATDAKALQDYQQTVMNQAQSELGAYDAKAAASGSAIGQADTQKDRARAQIAAGTAGTLAGMKYSQDESYLDRLHNLLPNTGSAASGFGGAGAIDAGNMNANNNIQQAILQLAGSGIFGQGKTPTNPFSGSDYGAGLPGDTEGPGGVFYPH